MKNQKETIEYYRAEIFLVEEPYVNKDPKKEFEFGISEDCYLMDILKSPRLGELKNNLEAYIEGWENLEGWEHLENNIYKLSYESEDMSGEKILNSLYAYTTKVTEVNVNINECI